MASTYLHKNQGSPTNAYKFTYSVWLKRSKIGVTQRFYQGYESGNNRLYAMMTSNDTIFCYGVTGGNIQINVETTRKYRDTNGWYNVVLKGDSTLNTATDRFQIWVNGVRETSLTISSNINQNTAFGNLVAQSNNTLTISGQESHNELWDGSMSHIHFTDGYAYDASAFGETDATTGEWKIKTSPSVTYGNTGYFILKDGNSVTDQSGNSNNFTVGGGTLTKTEDNPSNVFATLNPLDYESREVTLSNGNNTATFGGADDWSNHYGKSTLGMSSGKYYVEAKIGNVATNQLYPLAIVDIDRNITSSAGDNGIGAYSTGGIYSAGTQVQSGLGTWSNGDIAGAAFDATNGTLQFYRNGSTYGTQITGIDTSKTYSFCCNNYSGASVMYFNFGNGYFGTAAVSSAGTNASGNGIFEYDVPTGFTALSTKGLNL